MENKYYTPEIEEFHIGFEYEFRHPDYKNNGWIKYNTPQFNSEEEDCVPLDMKSENFRVKYLDREDIESFGFKHHKTISQEFYKQKDIFIKPNVYGYMIWEVKCQYRPDTNWFRLQALFEDGEWCNLFEAEIKNKSELKKLLKQSGIL